ncbi:kinesin-like protein KIN-14L isoform X2 [Andrographis paniculata]|nr:kinesin-like protein KIN-14L isoform X2 [Andrographis paniculata]
MEDLTRRGAIGGLDLASRKAEEAALRRYQAVHWLDYLVGPLGIPSQPLEKDFISCLRNGLILCKVMNIIQPGSVSKVVEKCGPSPLLWDSQPLPAYQYFENVRNFLVAVGELKLPNFEASIFERDNLEEGSSTKVVDCILALKGYHEWKQMTGGNGVYKPPKSPLLHSANRIHVRTPHLVPQHCARKLDMSGGNIGKMPQESDIANLEAKIVKALEEQLLSRKENINNNIVSLYYSGGLDTVDSIKILTSCLEEQLRKAFPEMNSSILDHLREQSRLPVQSTVVPLADLSNVKRKKCCRACLRKGSCNHWDLVEQQEKELSDIKRLLSSVKQEVELLQSQLHSDIKQLEDQVLEMSSAALGYQNAVKENRKLYNMVQDLKGSIRVLCRIRPACNLEEKNVIDFIGEDGSLVVVDPKHPRDRKQMFQFNHVFGPAATQDNVFRDIQPLVRSVMDGYSVCIFAYGQTGSGKTHTMFCPPDAPGNESGISYLALDDLFDLSDQRRDITKYEIQVQMFEIYDEQVFDLLAKDPGLKEYPSHLHKVEIRSCIHNNGMALPDATLLPVKSAADVADVMRLGEQNRAFDSSVAKTSRNSHSVLSVHIRGEDASRSTFHSCLRLVDLAGSTDKSLAGLVDVITALAEKHSHIPYQNSKLTLLLQDTLGGNAKTLMVAHVNPDGDFIEETMRTLRFAQRVSSVELGAPRANKESIEVLELKAQLESLKKAFTNQEWTSPMRRSKEGARTPPCQKPKQMADHRTPLPSRRMSIENSLTTPSARSTNGVNKRAVKTPPATTYSSRRSSLEGPRNNMQKDSCQIKLLDAVTPEARLDGKSIVKTSRTKETNAPLLSQRSPRSPTSAAVQTSVVRIDTATIKKSLPSFQTPMTQRDSIIIPQQLQTPSTVQSKVSHTRKSLRNIGKLIKGSDKRKPKLAEPETPRIVKSPTLSNARTSRRQSLTGLQPPGIRSSEYGIEDRNAKTPPPVGSSSKFIKRWL